MDVFTAKLDRHLQTFRELESLQEEALTAVKNNVLEGLSNLMTRQSVVLKSIGDEKADLKPYLDQWESLSKESRQNLRHGPAGEILDLLEKVAHGIGAKHQAMFGGEGISQNGGPLDGNNGNSGNKNAEAESEASQIGLNQTINLYRAFL